MFTLTLFCFLFLYESTHILTNICGRSVNNSWKSVGSHGARGQMLNANLRYFHFRRPQSQLLAFRGRSGNGMFFGGGDDDRWWCRLWMYFGYCCSVGPRPQVIPLVGPQHRLPLPRHRHYLLVDPIQKLVHHAGHRSSRNAQMNSMRVV